MSLQVDSSPSLRPAPIITARSSSSLGPNTHAKPTSTSATALAPLRYGKALYDFPAKETDELQLEEEDIIAISSIDSKGGWLYGENNGAWGWFPERYVRILNEDEAAGEGLIQTPSSVASSIVTSTPVLSSSATASSTSPVHAAALSDGGVDDDGPGDEAEDATGTLTPSSTFPKSAGVGWFTKKRPKKSKQLSTEEAKSISRAESVVSETGSSGGDVFPVVESRSRMNSAGPVEKHVRVLPPKKGRVGRVLQSWLNLERPWRLWVHLLK
ncbi:hypothetical protein BC829DRAFT_238913 [Chytridium lagenaria]|nr:hypothetical protein BC829DRAFT_238913 [Chytridium lagenaria]